MSFNALAGNTPSDDALINQSVNEMTSLFQRPETEPRTLSVKVASVGMLVLFGGTIAGICIWNHKGAVVVPLVGALALELWVLARLNTTLSQRELVRIVVTLQVYSIFAVTLQYFADHPSRVSAFVMLIPYLVYWFAVSGFFDRAIQRTAERFKDPHFIPTLQAPQPWHACQPDHRIAYNCLQGAKLLSALMLILNGLHVAAPYNILCIGTGNLLGGDAAAELAASVYTQFTDENLRIQKVTLLKDEGDDQTYSYSCSQKLHLTIREVLTNFSLFVGSTASAYALRYQSLPALIPAGVFVGFHQFFAKRELAENREWDPEEMHGIPGLRTASRVIGYGTATLLGAGICTYAVVETLSNKNWLTTGSAINSVVSAATGFFVSRIISKAWNQDSGVLLTALREHLIDNPVAPAYAVIVVNHVADQPIGKIGGIVLGELGLSLAAYLLGSEGARILDKRLIYGVVKMSPAAVVVLSHMLVPVAKAITNLR